MLQDCAHCNKHRPYYVYLLVLPFPEGLEEKQARMFRACRSPGLATNNYGAGKIFLCAPYLHRVDLHSRLDWNFELLVL